MTLSLGRRIALLAGAIALATSVLGTSAGAVAASTVTDSASIETVESLVMYPPDLKVTVVGIQHHAGGPDSYMFKVTNVGQGGARYMTLEREVWMNSTIDDSYLRKEGSAYTRTTPVASGESFGVEISCPANSGAYCNLGRLSVTNIGPVHDQNDGNNYATNNQNIYAP